MADPAKSTPPDGLEKSVGQTKTHTRRVLIVDGFSAVDQAILTCTPEHGRTQPVHAKTLADTQRALKDAGKIDLAIIRIDPSDEASFAAVDQVRTSDRATGLVLVTDRPDFALAQRALQLGALDLIVCPTDSPIDPAWRSATTRRLTAALDRQWIDRRRSTRVRKLKRLCRRLDAARAEVADQVDVLCNDLVTAYQELATQVQGITQTSGYHDAVGEELDLEAVLRKTLEYIVQQAGPCNAAVFLPSSADEFTLGGYVNYDCTKESADMLLEHLADVLAPQIAQRDDELLHATDNAELSELIGDDWNYLADCHLLALPASHEGEALAVIALFRDSNQPFTESAIDTLSHISEQMGSLLARIIRVHHRAVPGFDEPMGDPIEPSDTFLPPSQWTDASDAEDLDDEGELPF